MTSSGQAKACGRAGEQMGFGKKKCRKSPDRGAARAQRTCQRMGQQRKRGSRRQPGRRDDAAPSQLIVEGGKDDLRQPFVRNPCLPESREGKRILERNGPMIDDPPPDHDVGERVAIVEERMCGDNADGIHPEADKQRDKPDACRFGHSPVRRTDDS